MLVNDEALSETCPVKFVSYSGRYPNLCSGILTLNIDGIDVIFGNKFIDNTAQYPRFWESGCGDEWKIDVMELPEDFRRYAAEIDRVFNENVEHGCCGGCR